MASPPTRQTLVVELAESNGQSVLRLVALAALKGDTLVALTDPLGDGTLILPGVKNGGRYLFLKSNIDLGYISGQAFDNNNAALAHAPIAVDGFPVVALTAGGWQLRAGRAAGHGHRLRHGPGHPGHA